MPKYLVIAFYTFGTPYEDEVEGLRISCRKYGLELETVGYPTNDSWVRNAAIKPIST